MNRLGATLSILPIFSCIAPVAFGTLPGGDLLEPIKRIIARDDSVFKTIGPTPVERVQNLGFTAEDHETTTEDGYYVHMHRITGSDVSPKAENKPVVFLLHGLLDCSVTWILGDRNESLGYLLADQGYDVWLGNVRGNRFSRKHKWLSTKDEKFWAYSWHEIGMHDIPTMIDYVLGVTKQQKLIYVGHSQGCASFFVMSSLQPEYQKKVKAMFALAPAVFWGNCTLPLYRLLAPIVYETQLLTPLLGIYEFMPTPQLLQELGVQACDGTGIKSLCQSDIALLVSPGEELLSDKVYPEILKYQPAGSSMGQVLHFAQLVNTGKFQQYDHGFLSNLERYGSITPPEYPLEKVKLPVYIHYGNNDAFVDPKDVEILYSKLPNRKKFLVPKRVFTHLDFVWSDTAVPLVYRKLLKQIAKYRRN